MVQQITKVLDDPKLAQDLANRGRQQVKRYSWQTTAQQTLAVFDKVLSGQF
jgi:glycosyltransferase involved in cell wall biosynthesis